MQDYFASFLRYLSLLTLLLTMNLDAAPSAGSNSVRLADHVPTKAVNNAVFLKNLEAATPVSLTFTLPLRNQEDLEELVHRFHDPADKKYYGKYLSSEEFVEQFAPTQKDYDKVIAYAKKLGFTIKGTHPNRTLLNVVAPTKSIESAFNLRLQKYVTPKGREFHAPDNNPEVPVSIASIISGIVGLDNHAVWHAFHKRKHTKKPIKISSAAPKQSPSGPGGGYSPNDIVKGYNLSSVSENGSGQIIALFELGKYQASDITKYTNYFGLPTAKLKNVLVDGGASGGIDPEVTLDIELVLALAPQSQVYVYEGPNSNQGVLDTYNRIATDNIAKQVSTSWGVGENLESTQYLKAENAIFLQMAAHGQTIYAAAGDSGAYDDYPSPILVVDDPASQPYVVGVGGTKLKVNPESGAYESETVWNNGPGNGAGGGGVSVVWGIPAWQADVSTVYSKTHRNVPDVSLNADPDTGYSIYYDGQWTIFGGTSCAAPLWAAFTARVNQNRVSNENPVLGFANPALYSIATGSSYAETFHDVITGNNLYYQAKKGYDNASGWGSFDGEALFGSLTTSSAAAVASKD
jgi:kumamolisin